VKTEPNFISAADIIERNKCHYSSLPKWMRYAYERGNIAITDQFVHVHQESDHGKQSAAGTDMIVYIPAQIVVMPVCSSCEESPGSIPVGYGLDRVCQKCESSHYRECETCERLFDRADLVCVDLEGGVECCQKCADELTEEQASPSTSEIV
jgi:hypothetical protein